MEERLVEHRRRAPAAGPTPRRRRATPPWCARGRGPAPRRASPRRSPSSQRRHGRVQRSTPRGQSTVTCTPSPGASSGSGTRTSVSLRKSVQPAGLLGGDVGGVAHRVGLDPVPAPPSSLSTPERRVETRATPGRGRARPARKPSAAAGADARGRLDLALLVRAAYSGSIRHTVSRCTSPIALASRSPGVPRHGTGLRLDEVRVDGPDTYWLAGRRARAGAPPWSGTRHPGPGGAARRLGTCAPGCRSFRRRHVHRARRHAGVLAPWSTTACPAGCHRRRAGRHHAPGPWRIAVGLVLHGDHVSRCVRTTPATPARQRGRRLDLHGAPRRRDGPRDRHRLPCPAGGLPRRQVPRPGSRGRSPTYPGTTTGSPARADRQGAGDPVVVAGGDVSVVPAPTFGSDGALWFLSDEWRAVVGRAARDTGPARSRCTRRGRPRRPPVGPGNEFDLAVLDADRALVRWSDDATPARGARRCASGEI